MDPKTPNAYSTEIPVSEAEKELHHTPTATTAPPPITPPILTIPPPPPANSSTGAKRLPAILIGILSVAIVFLAGYLFRGYIAARPATPTAAIPTPTKSVVPTTPTPTPVVIAPPAATSNRFSSPELGILFDTAKLLPESVSDTILTQIDGSRAYVYASTTQASSGQYVDVLSKISTDTAVEAAQKITSNDSRFSACTFEISPQSIYPTTYERVIPNCPDLQSVGLRYFLTDTKHPTSLLFVNIGQYGLPAAEDSQLLWQDTLRFL